MKRLAFALIFILLIALMVYGLTLLSDTLGLIQTETSAQVMPVARRSQLDTLVRQGATPTLVSIELIEAISAEDQVLINLYQRVNPSVVNIEITQRTTFYDGLAASGSGFVFDNQGHIVTNAHVVADAIEIQVTFHDGYVTTAEVVGTDEYSDLAVIRVDVNPERLHPVILGDSNQLLVGQRVVAIGNPFGLQSSLTRGIVSAVGRALPSARLISQANQAFNNPSIIQVDAPINPGNSGGPLLNYLGEVVGINAAIRTETGTFQGVAFAIPVNTLKRVVPQLIEKGKAEYSWLGVSTFPDEPGLNVATLAEPLGLPVDHGVMIEEVGLGSPAAKAGLKGGNRVETFRGIDVRVGGDIIVAINGVFVRDLDQLLGYLVENTSPGDTITLTVIRDDQTLDVPVLLGVRP
jgi:2-alkenal reductase